MNCGMRKLRKFNSLKDTMHSKLLLCPDGGPFSSDCLETGLDGLDRASGVACHTLEEKETSLLVEDGVWRAAGVAGHILLDVPPQDIFNVFLLELAFHDQLVIAITGSSCTQLGK